MLSRVLGPHWSLAAMVALAALGCAACTSEGQGRPDSELGNLVISPTPTVQEVDIDKATTDAEELLAAVLLPHTWIGERLGAHLVRGGSTVTVRTGEQVVEDIEDTLFLDFDGEERFVATLDNSREYGRHVVFDGTHLYLRPRFGLYHQRPPQSEDEVPSIRNEMAGGAGDYLDLLARGLEVSDKGVSSHNGRDVRRVELKVAPSPRALPPEDKTQRLWRNTIEVKHIQGYVALDAQTGAAVDLDFEGRISFVRDGNRFDMTVSAKRTIEEIGHKRVIEAPPADERMAIEARRRELNERNTLLENIAPPARRAPTPDGADGADR